MEAGKRGHFGRVGVWLAWATLLPGSLTASVPHEVSVGNCNVEPTVSLDGCAPFAVLNQDDPLQRVASQFPSGSPAGAEYWLLQRSIPVDQVWLDNVEDPTVNVLAIMAEQGLLLRLLPGGMTHLQDVGTSHPGETRALWRYREAYKPVWSVAGVLDPFYGPFDNHVDAKGMLRLRALMHRGEDPSWYLSALQLLLPAGSVVLATTSNVPGAVGANAYLDLWIPASPVDSPKQALQVLSATDAIANINTWDSPEDALNEVVWSTQTNINRSAVGVTDGYDTAAKHFAHGVTGRGQVVTILDRGFLPHVRGLCGLRYGPNDSDAPPEPTYAVQPPDAWSGAPSEFFTPQNKVIAHYMIESLTLDPRCQPYPTATQWSVHGRNTTMGAAGDSFGVVAARAGVEMDDPTDDELVTDPQAALIGPISGPRDIATRLVDHHQDRDGVAPGAQVIIQDFNPPNPEEHSPTSPNLPYIECRFAFLDILWQAHETADGARIHNNSWGVRTNLGPSYPVDPQYHDTAIDYDLMTWSQRDFLPVFSAGNEVPASGSGSSLRREANLKNGLSVGQTSGNNTYAGPAGSCSHGPGYGFRIKPDLTGLNILGKPGCSETWRTEACGDLDDTQCCVATGFHCMGSTTQSSGGGGSSGVGTSNSAPIVSGMAALARQYFIDGYYPGGAVGSSAGFVPTNALLKASLINSCRGLTGVNSGDGYGQSNPDSRPTFGQGWGGPVLDDTLFFAGDPTPGPALNAVERSFLVVLTDSPNGLADVVNLNHRRTDMVDSLHAAITQGDVQEYSVWVGDATTSPQADGFHVTLAWSDPPGNFIDANPAPQPTSGEPFPPLVNDLDLEIVDPAGVVWRSNPGTSENDLMRLWLGGISTARPTRPFVPIAPCPAACASTCPQPSSEELNEQSVPATCDFQTRDRMNNVENVIIPQTSLISGYYRVRVVGWRVLGNGYAGTWARPNWDDTDGDLDHDFNDDTRQGYALIATGKIATNRGMPHFDRSYYKCGDPVFVNVNDADALAGATVRVVSGDPSAPLDCEILTLGGSAPFLQTASPVALMDLADPLAGANTNACQISATPVLVTEDDSDIHVIYEGELTPPPPDYPRAPENPLPEPIRYAWATAAARLTCRDVSLAAISSPVQVFDGLACATQAQNNVLSRGEQAALQVHLGNITDKAVTGLLGTLFSFDEDVHVYQPSLPCPDLAPLDPDQIVTFQIYLDFDHDCESAVPLRFRLELSGSDGFKDRIYFDIPQDCAGMGGPPEVPASGAGASGVDAMRVTKPGNFNVRVTWIAPLGVTNCNIWRGDVASFQTGTYSHVIDLANNVGACNIDVTTGGPSFFRTFVGEANPIGVAHCWYYLVNAETACLLAPDGETQGTFGWADRDGNGVNDPEELRPQGQYLSPGCL